jgi:hypothetical protein
MLQIVLGGDFPFPNFRRTQNSHPTLSNPRIRDRGHVLLMSTVEVSS